MLDFAPSPHSPRFAFGKHDVVRINGTEYYAHDTTADGYILVRTDGGGVAETYSRTEMARLVSRGVVEHDRNALLPESARERLAAPSDMLSKLPEKMHLEAKRRESVVLAFLQLEQEGKVKRSDKAIQAALVLIENEAGKILSVPSGGEPVKRRRKDRTVPGVGARSVRRWVKAYEDLGLSGLYDGTGRRGNRARRMTHEELAVMSPIVNRFMSRNRPTQATIYQDIKVAFAEANARRRAEGRPDLATPSRETVRQAIRSLDPFQCDIARDGLEVARRKHRPVGKGLDITRPLQRIEMDNWTVDLVSLMAESGLLHYLSDEDKARLGLDKSKARWHLTVAICAATRCIVSMRLSRAPSSRSAIQTIEMIMRDKGAWTDAVGPLSAWSMCGKPELIVTDCGTDFVSFDTRVAARDLGIRIEHTPGGCPEMRARIERVFRTISLDLMPRLTGRTFSNMIEKGDYDPVARAALTADDLCAALIRWVVDIYHRKPHEGLDGESPARCWERLTEMYGICPAPDLRRRRLAFGTPDQRTVTKSGIKVLGVRYHSEGLARWAAHSRDKTVNLRWYAEDIGAIAVELNGEWVEVPAVLECHHGVRSQTWLAAARLLRAHNKQQAALDEDIVYDAIRHVEAIDGEAMRRMGLLVEDWSPERMKYEEDHLFVGFDCQAVERRAPKTELDSGFGVSLATAAPLDSHTGEKNSTVAGDSVSDPLFSTACVAHEPGSSLKTGEPGDDPGWEIEDK